MQKAADRQLDRIREAPRESPGEGPQKGCPGDAPAPRRRRPPRPRRRSRRAPAPPRGRGRWAPALGGWPRGFVFRAVILHTKLVGAECGRVYARPPPTHFGSVRSSSGDELCDLIWYVVVGSLHDSFFCRLHHNLQHFLLCRKDPFANWVLWGPGL